MSEEEHKFEGVYTAIVTPFTEDGKDVDFDVLAALTEMNIAGGVNGIVYTGTTGESPTLTDEEQTDIWKRGVEQVGGRVLVIAGTGSNVTKDAIKYTEAAKEAGVDGVLVVSPYYNKPSVDGQIDYFTKVADVGVPVIVYNIRGRTGQNIETSTIVELAGHKYIVADKEASGSLQQALDVIEQTPEGFSVLSGDDGNSRQLVRIGGQGVISVWSNIMPAEMVEMITTALSGNHERAMELDGNLRPLYRACFPDGRPNPEGAKYVLGRMGKIPHTGGRSPIMQITKENHPEIAEGIDNDMETLALERRVII